MGIKRFPKKRGAPALKPCCGQCGRELTGRDLRERDEDYEHELQAGVGLNLRIFAEHSNPHNCGHVHIRLSSEEISIGWSGEKQYGMALHELLILLARWEQEGCEIVRPRPMPTEPTDVTRPA